MSSQPNHGLTEGEQGKRRGRRQRSWWIKKSPAQKIHQDDRAEIYETESKMDARWCLSQRGHDDGVSRIDPGHFEVIKPAIGRNALEQQLAGIGVFALVPLERHRAGAPAHYADKEHDEH